MTNNKNPNEILIDYLNEIESKEGIEGRRKALLKILVDAGITREK